MAVGGLQEAGAPKNQGVIGTAASFDYLPGIPLLGGGKTAIFRSSAKWRSFSSRILSLRLSLGVLSTQEK